MKFRQIWSHCPLSTNVLIDRYCWCIQPVWPDWVIFGIWATFYSLRQQLICPNFLILKQLFVKVSKSIIFLVKSFLGNFCRHLAIFSGHTVFVTRRKMFYSINPLFSNICSGDQIFVGDGWPTCQPTYHDRNVCSLFNPKILKFSLCCSSNLKHTFSSKIRWEKKNLKSWVTLLRRFPQLLN